MPPILNIDCSRTDDDPQLWDVVIAHLLNWLEPQIDVTKRRPLFIRVGPCSHWRRPHSWRHTLAGSKGWPRGYGDGGTLPQLDWAVLLHWQPKEHSWQLATGLHTKRYYLFQVAIPSRSARHNQALVHSRWLPGPRRVQIQGGQTLFHFQKSFGHWQFSKEIALSKEDET
jgi:hypothetical protein